MNWPQEPIVLLPLDGESAGPGPGFLDRILAMLGQGRLAFPCLGAKPGQLTGVLMTCQGNPGRVTVNGREVKPAWRRDGRVLFGPEAFGRWENVLWASRDAKVLHLAPVVEAHKVSEGLDLPPGSRWRLQTLAGTDLGELTQERRPPGRAKSILEGLARGLAAMVAPNGDVWSFYDLPAGSYRLPGWRWDTGLVLEAMASGAECLDDPGLLASAMEVGDRLLDSRLDHPECPGGFPEWVDPRYSESEQDLSQWVVPFNAAFIAAGLARLAHVSGHTDFLQAGRQGLFLAAKLGLTKQGGLSGYYFERSRKWRYLGQINDSGVLGRGLGLFPDEPWAGDAARLAAEYVLARAGNPDGHIGRAWWDPSMAVQAGQPLFPEWGRRPRRVVPKIFWRGQAWVMMGLTGALRLGAGEEVRQGAKRLAAYIVNGQQPDGSWLYSGLEPRLGACAKTTAALALALAEWSALNNDAGCLAAVRRGLVFLESCRRPEEVPPELSGLPVEGSREGCIIYFRDRPVVCAYAGALELLARLAVGEGP
jgi:hypothetical protein